MAVKKECAICRFYSRVERVEHTVLFYYLLKGNRDILEAVFAVKIEAGDGMSGHACRSCFSAAQLSSTSCKQ